MIPRRVLSGRYVRETHVICRDKKWGTRFKRERKTCFWADGTLRAQENTVINNNNYLSVKIIGITNTTLF